MSELFPDLPETRMFGAQGKRHERRMQISTWKATFGIWTHNAPGAGDWMALSMPECVKRLEGHNLTEDEKTNGIELMAGYCRLLDDYGLLEGGHRTEHAACLALVTRLTTPPAPGTTI